MANMIYINLVPCWGLATKPAVSPPVNPYLARTAG